MVAHTTTPYSLLARPDKEKLKSEFVGKSLEGIRTPALVIDRHVFAENCAKMHKRAEEWGATFRAHLKTHKTVEGTLLQLKSEGGHSNSVVVSTLLEAWEVVRAGLVEDQTVVDILYGLPVSVNKIDDLSELWQTMERYGGIVRLMVDHPEQIEHLEKYEMERPTPRRWSVFIKVHNGQNRAGVRPESPEFRGLLQKVLGSPVISLHGFYGHAGNSYASTSIGEASSFLSSEVRTVNFAAAIALEELNKFPQSSHHTQPFILSVGSTPTAHAAGADARKLLKEALHGHLELHAGNYPMLDLQQSSTSLIGNSQISQKVKATVVSYYPKRGDRNADEVLIDAGAIAFSKDTGPSGNYGEVIGKPWKLSRISQEHGILTQAKDELKEDEKLQIGSTVEIIGQHACLIAAAYLWYYIVDQREDGGRQIVDIWVPWKGW